MARRIRTHTNPLSYPTPISREQWTSKLEEGKKLFVDMGCGEGDYIIDLSKQDSDSNFIGVEVRPSMVEKVDAKINEGKYENVICLQGNASISLRTMFKKGEVNELYINFPDPWFKEKHKKRRIIKETALDDMDYALSEDGIIMFMTDVEEVFDEFVDIFKLKFKEIEYVPKNIQSYWEKWNIKKGKDVHRAAFIKQSK